MDNPDTHANIGHKDKQIKIIQHKKLKMSYT